MAIKRYAGDRFTGLSTDIKPTNATHGALFLETDTGSEFYYNGSTWTSHGYITTINLGTTYTATTVTVTNDTGGDNATLASATITDAGVMSAADKIKLEGIDTDADVNQNAFSNIAVAGQTTVAADAVTDTLNLAAGSNVSIATDAVSDTVTINSDNYFLSGLAFNTLTGDLTATVDGTTNQIVNLDGRYLTTETDSQTLTWNGTNGELSISNGNTVDIDGRYVESAGDTMTGNLTIDKTTPQIVLDESSLFWSITLSGSNAIYSTTSADHVFRVGASTLFTLNATDATFTVPVIATSFTGDGSGLSSVNADTLDTLNSTDFLRSAQNTIINDANGEARFYFADTNITAIFGGAGASGLTKIYRDDAFTDEIASFGNGVTFSKTTAVNAAFFNVNDGSAGTSIAPDGDNYFVYGATNFLKFQRHLGSGTYSDVATLDSAGDANFSGAIKQTNFEMVYNDGTDSLDFNYIG